MNAIIERIKEAYHLETDAEVAKFLDIKPSTLSMQKNRGRLNLERIIEKCSDLNKNWLLDGKGEMRTAGVRENGKGIPIFTDLEIKNSQPDFDQSPLAGEIYTNVSDEIELVADPVNIIGLVTPGNAMAPVLKKKDIAIIDLGKKPVDNSICLITSQRRALLRRIKEKNGAFVAKSENGNHQPITVNSNNNARVIGKLIWVLRRF